MLLPIHIAAGGLAIVLGAVALVVRKGGTIHRRSGLLFVYAMLVMGFSATLLELRKTPIGPNVFAGFVTAYFVGTAVTTLRPPSRGTRLINLAGITTMLALALLGVVRGVIAFDMPGRALGGAPFFMFFFLAGMWALAAAGDIRVMRSGIPRGAPRLARHLWRMCFALFIAAGSFFSIRERVAKLLPEPFTSAPMRALPIVLLFGAMFYWLWRVRGRRLQTLTWSADRKSVV